jgi:tRNA (guanine10-N2)-dimethyltransferase
VLGQGFVTVIHCEDPEWELAAAEAWAFTGGEARGRLVYSPQAVDITRSAYLHACLEIEAQGANLAELLADCRRQGMAYEGFRITLFRPPPKVSGHGEQIIRQVADAITGDPDLSTPRVQLGLVGSQHHWLVGRLISCGRNHWRRGIDRPVHFSSALPQRFSRALVNLVASPGDTLIDPCCGVGTPLIEATEAGIIAVGADYNPKMLTCLALNLAHLGLPQRLFHADARTLGGRYEGAVMDLPYGRNLKGPQTPPAELIAPLRQVARRIALVSAVPLDSLLPTLGLRLIRAAQVPKGQLVRHVYLVAGSDA